VDRRCRLDFIRGAQSTRRREPGYEAAGLDICSALYARRGGHSAPILSYAHTKEVVPGDACDLNNGSALSGLAFYTRGAYPGEYEGGLFFSDFARGCIWVLPRDALESPRAQPRQSPSFQSAPTMSRNRK
jgi:hypothetical protein